MAGLDYIVVGSGINVAAAMLGKKGKEILLLKRNDHLGGCLRTEEIIEPGFVHDPMDGSSIVYARDRRRISSGGPSSRLLTTALTYRAFITSAPRSTPGRGLPGAPAFYWHHRCAEPQRSTT